MRKVHPRVSALVEVGILCQPAILAYIWLWPAVSGTALLYPVQCLVYVCLVWHALHRFPALEMEPAWAKQARDRSEPGLRHSPDLRTPVGATGSWTLMMVK